MSKQDGERSFTIDQYLGEITDLLGNAIKQIAALTAENARLKAPVSDAEIIEHVCDPELAMNRELIEAFNALIAARASTSPDANTSWFCVPCGFTTKDAAEAQAHLGPHMIRFKCSFCEATCGFHTQEQFDLNVQKHLARHAAQLSTPTPEAR